jgi:hypothetical protein
MNENDILSVRYIERPGSPEWTTYRVRDGGQAVHGLIGMYEVKFTDGCTVMMPHTGWEGTISAEPQDVDYPEHRAIIVDDARRAKFVLIKPEYA